MASETQRQAIKNYLSKLKTWTIRIKPEEAERIEQAAAKAGQSKNEYVLEAIRHRMELSSTETPGGDFEKNPSSSMADFSPSCSIPISQAQIGTLEKVLLPIILSTPLEQRDELKKILSTFVIEAVDKHKEQTNSDPPSTPV